MPTAIPEQFLDLLKKPAFGLLATLMPDGHPQVTPVWCDLADGYVLVNSARGRQKDRNLRRDPRIIISVQDRNDPQSYMVFHGKASVTEAGADEHIDKLAKRFLGVDKYPFRRPGEKRLIVRIKVDRIGGYGPKMAPWV